MSRQLPENLSPFSENVSQQSTAELQPAPQQYPLISEYRNSFFTTNAQRPYVTMPRPSQEQVITVPQQQVTGGYRMPHATIRPSYYAVQRHASNPIHYPPSLPPRAVREEQVTYTERPRCNIF